MAKKRKSELTPDEIRNTSIGCKTVAEWEKLWEPLPNAFSDDHSDLRNIVGLFRIILNGETKYIVRATEPKGGIAKGLRRISGPDQTGNRGYGARKVREHLDEVTVEILRVGSVGNSSEIAKELKRELNRLHNPVWGIPHKRRMKMIQDGVLPPD
ncbi:hypothetical protein [Croceicoccus sediminis]|uniref:hypothetical protein n=1 Tax=Croceicoccus sediminis TaxID=2571150 RepID=UPI0011839E04|nr:hypothetical protein [Croceicoccus sediminis]